VVASNNSTTTSESRIEKALGFDDDDDVFENECTQKSRTMSHEQFDVRMNESREISIDACVCSLLVCTRVAM
jgi:hypothetical protein